MCKDALMQERAVLSPFSDCHRCPRTMRGGEGLRPHPQQGTASGGQRRMRRGRLGRKPPTVNKALSFSGKARPDCSLPDRPLKWMFSTHPAPRAFSACCRDDKIAPRARSSRREPQGAAHDPQGRNPMARKHPRPEVSRRKFLAGAAVAGATTALAPPAAKAAAATDASITAPRRPSTLPPTMQVAIAETATPKELPRIGGVPGSDFMVDLIKTLDIKYLPSNPASSFRAIHESLINYGGNKMPEFLTCAHEESAVAMAHGYFKVTGKPLMTLCHGTVGLQHAAMAVYNAWCDRVPVIVVGGNDLDAAHRPPGVPTIHPAQDINAHCRQPSPHAAGRPCH